MNKEEDNYRLAKCCRYCKHIHIGIIKGSHSLYQCKLNKYDISPEFICDNYIHHLEREQ